MRVLFINPSIAQAEVYAKYSAGAPVLPPLGLCYLAAVLLKEGHEVKILDCVAERISLSNLQQTVREFRPDVAGVTATTVSFEAAKRVFKAVKETDDRIVTILGGAHVSALPRPTMAECEDIDVGVFGEGEDTIREAVEKLEIHRPLLGVPGTVIRQNGDIIENDRRAPIQNMDDIPFPARHLLKDLHLYSHTPFRGARFMTTMITSRGCVFNCGFCDQSVFGRAWRHHSAEYVVSEIAHLKESYGVDFISFEDDNFMISKKRTAEICLRMTKDNFQMSWSCLGHVSELDEEVLPLMKAAGCRTIYLGIESGSPRILELVNKKIGLEDIRRGVKLIKKHNISVTGSFILGLPTETREEIEETIRFALSLPLDGVSFFTFTPYPNTRLRDLALQHGRVSERWADYSGHPNYLPFVPDGFDEKGLLDIQRRAYQRFLLRPGYLIKHLSTLTSSKALRSGGKFLRALFSRSSR
jgi:anaerobic magnesium-protoporphyrin IX monomethyl ester cyclase